MVATGIRQRRTSVARTGRATGWEPVRLRSGQALRPPCGRRACGVVGHGGARKVACQVLPWRSRGRLGRRHAPALRETATANVRRVSPPNGRRVDGRRDETREAAAPPSQVTNLCHPERPRPTGWEPVRLRSGQALSHQELRTGGGDRRPRPTKRQRPAGTGVTVLLTTGGQALQDGWRLGPRQQATEATRTAGGPDDGGVTSRG